MLLRKFVILLLFLFINLFCLTKVFAESVDSIPISEKILDAFLQQEFFVNYDKSTANNLVLYHKTRVDIEVEINSSSSLEPIDFILIKLLYNDVNIDNTRHNLHLQKDTLKQLQDILKILPCSEEEGFLTSNFICNKLYYVSYEKKIAFLEKIRSLLDIPSNNSVIIKIANTHNSK